CRRYVCVFFVFFFQAEDGIRDFHVTGVQTCALPISVDAVDARPEIRAPQLHVGADPDVELRHDRERVRRDPVVGEEDGAADTLRSEERRVGKEGRWRRSAWE